MDPDARVLVAAAARAHHGVIAAAEATRLGMTRGQLRQDVQRGIWHRPVPGVLVGSAVPPSWQQAVAVATTSTGGVASHRSAARLHELDGHRHHDIVELSIERHRRMDRTEWVVHQAAALAAPDLTVVDGLRVTSLARTLVDLGAVVSDDLVEQALDDALRRGASLRWIIATLDRMHRPGPSGTASLHRVLARQDRRGPLPDSVFERLVERAVRAAGLEPPDRQVVVRDESGLVVARLDAAWTDRQVGSEAQSAEWHGGRRGSQADIERHNRLTAMGWRMLYATWADVQDPRRYIDALRRLLAPQQPVRHA
jgi:hypothetical protein